METILSFIKAVASAAVQLVRLAMSLRACGVKFYPLVSRNKDGTYLVEAWLKPGRDEVRFDTFRFAVAREELSYSQASSPQTGQVRCPFSAKDCI